MRNIDIYIHPIFANDNPQNGRNRCNKIHREPHLLFGFVALQKGRAAYLKMVKHKALSTATL